MKDWTNLSILDYHHLLGILKSENHDSELERDVKLLSLLSGKEEAYYDEMTMPEFNQHRAHLAFLDKLPVTETNEVIKVNGKEYKICLDAFKLTAGQYTDLMHFSKQPNAFTSGLHLILACICLPKNTGFKRGWQKYGDTNHSEVADNLLDANYLDCYNAAVFFWNLSSAFRTATVDYLTRELSGPMKTEKEELRNQLTTLLNAGDGSAMPKA